MATKPHIAAPMTTDFGLEHSEHWLPKDEWLTWSYVCPIIRRSAVPLILEYGQSEETAPQFRVLVEFVRDNFLASTKQPTRLVTPRQAWERYVELVRGTSEVQEVWLSDDAEGTTIWTIIDTPRFDKDLRRRVYQPQIDVLRASHKPMVRFRILNLNDLEDTVREHILPRGSKQLILETY